MPSITDGFVIGPDEGAYNGLRLAGSLARREGVEVTVFLVGDAVGCVIANQDVPDGYLHLDRMLGGVIGHGGEAGCLGDLRDAQALPQEGLVQGARRSSTEPARS